MTTIREIIPLFINSYDKYEIEWHNYTTNKANFPKKVIGYDYSKHMDFSKIINPEKALWLMYQTTEKIIDYDENRLFKWGLPCHIYRLSDTDQDGCLGQFIYNVFDDTVTYSAGTIPIKRNRQYTDEFLIFVDKLYKDFNECKGFTSIAFAIEGLPSEDEPSHQNLILMFREKMKSKIMLYIYDPHGTRGVTPYSDIIRKIANKFPKYITDVRPTKFGIGYRSSITSCPVGLQLSTNDTIGFCVLFVYFWLFCVLLTTKNIDSTMCKPNIVKDVEKYIADEAKTPERLFKVILYFGILLNKDYLESYIKSNKKLYSNFSHRVPFYLYESFVDGGFQNSNLKKQLLIRIAEEKYSVTNVNDLSLTDAHKILYTDKNISSEHKKVLKNIIKDIQKILDKSQNVKKNII